LSKQCQELPGYELFEYTDSEGSICRIDSGDVNEYIREASGADFTAKDFRTWAGTLLATQALHQAGPARNATSAKRAVVDAVKSVASGLGNRPATSRKYYIHPAVIEAYEDGSLFPVMQRGEEQNGAYAGLGLRPEEYAVMVIVASYQDRLAKAARQKAA